MTYRRLNFKIFYFLYERQSVESSHMCGNYN